MSITLLDKGTNKINREQAISQISSEFHQICNRENPQDAIDAMEKALTTVLVINYPKDAVRDVVLGFAKNVVKNYNEIYSQKR